MWRTRTIRGMPGRATLVLLPLLGGLPSRGPAEAAQPGRDELVGLVIDAMENYFGPIETAELTVREVVEDATVAQRKVTVHKTPDGRQVRVSRTPRRESYAHVLLGHGDLRVDRARRADGTAVFERLARIDGIWTQHVPESGAAWIRRPNGMPGMFPIDPRQVGSQDIRRSLIDVLREDTILSARLTRSPGGEDRVRIVAKPLQGTPTTYEFSGSVGFLPTRFTTRWPDGSLLQLTDYQYQDVLDGKAKFLKKVTRAFFAQGVTRQPREDQWRQRIIREVTGAIVLNRPVAREAIAITLPPGTRIYDATRSDIYVSQQPINGRPLSWWWYGLAFLGCAALLVSLKIVRHESIEGGA